MTYCISYTRAAGTAHARADTAADALKKGKELDQQGFHVRIIEETGQEFSLTGFQENRGRGTSALPKCPSRPSH
jgi:hypothetical protein